MVSRRPGITKSYKTEHSRRRIKFNQLGQKTTLFDRFNHVMHSFITSTRASRTQIISIELNTEFSCFLIFSLSNS